MIGLLHAFFLEGTGSNIWTRSIVKSLCRNGETVHLVCQENHPENYDFVAEHHYYLDDNTVETKLKRDVPYVGKCVIHQPQLDVLPVFAWDKYEGFPNAIPMIKLPNSTIEDYLERNIQVVLKIMKNYGPMPIHTNHAVLLSVVAQRVNEITSIPFAIMPHGSAIEYAIKKDQRFLDLALKPFESAKKIFVVSEEMKDRVTTISKSS